MAFPNRLLSNSTWRHLGLGFAGILFSLSTLAILKPLQVADIGGLSPTTPDGESMVEKSLMMLGARDLCIATALCWFYSEGKAREMGMVMTSGVMIYVFDIWIAATGPRRWDEGVWGLCGAAVGSIMIGLGLLQS